MIYIGQDFDVALTGDVDLSTASPLKIRFEKGDRTTGEVTATYSGTGNLIATGSITPEINTVRGTWTFQIEAVISSKTYFSSITRIPISTPITDPT